MIQVSSATTEAARAMWAGVCAVGASPDAVSAAIERHFALVGSGLGRWIGTEGFRALLQGAVHEAALQHPPLRGLRCLDDGEADVAGAVRAHGVEATLSGMEAVIALLIHSLGQVIGEEMATRLIEQTLAADSVDITAQARRGNANG